MMKRLVVLVIPASTPTDTIGTLYGSTNMPASHPMQTPTAWNTMSLGLGGAPTTTCST